MLLTRAEHSPQISTRPYIFSYFYNKFVVLVYARRATIYDFVYVITREAHLKVSV